jgi:hypothetical protein
VEAETMRRSQPPRAPSALLRILILSGVLAATLAAPVAAQDQSPAPMAESPAPMAASPAPMAADGVDLPAGWQPEGIARLGDALYVGSLADGAIYRIDATTREGSILVPGTEGSVAAGIEADEPNGRIWVAGGPTGEVRVYAADSGDLLETYTFEGAGFLNDLAFNGDGVYVTDSNVAQLAVIPLGADGSLPTRRAVGTVPLTGDLVYQADAFNANGIVAADDGSLILVQSVTGGLFLVDPSGGYTTAIDAGGADLTFGDGLELDGSTLYVARNQAEVIATLELDESRASATLVSEATSDDLDIPTTMARSGDDLWIVNARFGTEATAETPYWVSVWPGARPPAM